MKHIQKQTFKIAKHEIKEHGKIFTIAEAGVNHNGKLDLALKLVDVAADAGVDVVKFQTFKAKQVVTDVGEMASYQKKNLGEDKSQVEMLQELELKEEFYQPIIERCKQRNILFMSTPHGGVDSVDFLESLNIQAYKIGSGDLTNYLLLKRVAETGKPIIISVGMATLKEIKSAIKFITDLGNSKIVILQCTTNYPCDLTEINLAAMETMMNELGMPVGFSDHTQSLEAVTVAALMGMCLYECHFTIDQSLPGPDHIASASPDELKQRIKIIKETEKLNLKEKQEKLAKISDLKTILGNSIKKPTKSEAESMLELVRRSLVYKRTLKAGHQLTLNDLEAKRPGDGISPIQYQKFIGKKLTSDVKFDQQISEKDF